MKRRSICYINTPNGYIGGCDVEFHSTDHKYLMLRFSLMKQLKKGIKIHRCLLYFLVGIHFKKGGIYETSIFTKY